MVVFSTYSLDIYIYIHTSTLQGVPITPLRDAWNHQQPPPLCHCPPTLGHLPGFCLWFGTYRGDGPTVHSTLEAANRMPRFNRCWHFFRSRSRAEDQRAQLQAAPKKKNRRHETFWMDLEKLPQKVHRGNKQKLPISGSFGETNFLLSFAVKAKTFGEWPPLCQCRVSFQVPPLKTG